MAFHLGRPIFVMTALSLACGAWLAIHHEPQRKQMTLWVFAVDHDRDYPALLDPRDGTGFEKTVDVSLVPARAMDMRLPVLFLSPGNATELPDAVEVDIGSIGLYLRPPANDIGFLPLNRYLQSTGVREIESVDSPGQTGWNARLKSDGRIFTFDGRRWVFNSRRDRPDAWIDRILANRLASASKDGLYFGVPHDVHPVALAFRDDLFREAGVPLVNDAGKPLVATWAEFADRCLRFQAYWKSRGFPTRHAIELPTNNSGMLSIMLAQRRLNLVAADGTIQINDPKVAQTLAFYIRLVVGDEKIGAEAAADTGLEYKDFSDGNLCALLMPDWKVNELRRHAPAIAGKMRLMPLPRFDPHDAPTASYGGTLVCIPRACKQPDEAWRLIEYLYFSPASMADRKKLGILPPMPEAWTQAEYHEPDPFFGGQKSLEIYAGLAPQAPPTLTTPIHTMALLTLSFVQSRVVSYARKNGPADLEHQCQIYLDAAALDLQRRIDHARFGK